MSEVNKSKTLMINPILDKNGKELLIKTKFISKEIIDHEKSYFEYEKLKHKLKKRLREKIIDEFALKISENESKKDIYTFASVNVKCDSRGLYHRLKKINENQNKNVQNKLKAYFKIWLYQTPNALIKNKINKNSKNDRNRTIKIKYYSYQNVRYSNIAQKTTDMTTRKNRQKIQIQTPINKKLEQMPKFKYNYSCNNSKISYNKFEFGKNDDNKGNIYIGKKNGNAYYYEKKYNNFGSLTIIQHNVENSKKYKNVLTDLSVIDRNLLIKSSRNKKIHSICDSQKTLRSSKSSWTIFCNSISGRKARENTEIKESLN